MDTRRPIDIKRERGGSGDIGTKEDGAITEMYNLGGRLLIIKERSVYEYKLADSIDPNRENPDLPLSIQTLIRPLGSESEIFSRIFLTARRLFQTQFLDPKINTEQVIWLTLEVVQEISAMDKKIKDYLNAEKKAVDNYELTKFKSSSYQLPSITDVNT